MFNATLTIPTFSMSLGDVHVFCSIRPHILIDHAKVCIKNYPSRLMFLIPLFCVCVCLCTVIEKLFITKDLCH